MINHDFSAMILLAQDGAAPPTESAPPPAGITSSTGSPGVPGSTAAPGGAAPRPAGPDLFGGGFLWVFVLIIGGMIVFSMLGNRREKRKRDSMLGALKKHDKVQTIGGVIGSVVEVKASTVVLKVDESSNTRMTFARSAIQQVLDVAPDSDSSSSVPGA